MQNNKSPKFLFDCNECKFSWCCGPCCKCCCKTVKEDLRTQRWHPATVEGFRQERYLFDKNSNLKDKDRLNIVEIKCKRKNPRKNDIVEFRMGGRNKKDLIVPKTKWMKGVVVTSTSKWRNKKWGFRVILIAPEKE